MNTTLFSERYWAESVAAVFAAAGDTFSLALVMVRNRGGKSGSGEHPGTECLNAIVGWSILR